MKVVMFESLKTVDADVEICGVKNSIEGGQ